MDKNLKSIRKLHIQKTMENLEKNNMTAIYADSKEQVISTIAGLLKDRFSPFRALSFSGQIRRRLVRRGNSRYLPQIFHG